MPPLRLRLCEHTESDLKGRRYRGRFRTCLCKLAAPLRQVRARTRLYTCPCTCPCTYPCTYPGTCPCTCTCTWPPTRVRARTHTHIHAHVDAHIDAHVHTHVRTHVRAHVHTHADTNIHTHAYTHAYTHVHHRSINMSMHMSVHIAHTSLYHVHTQDYASSVRIARVHVSTRDYKHGMPVSDACWHTVEAVGILALRALYADHLHRIPWCSVASILIYMAGKLTKLSTCRVLHTCCA